MNALYSSWVIASTRAVSRILLRGGAQESKQCLGAGRGMLQIFSVHTVVKVKMKTGPLGPSEICPGEYIIQS